LTAGFDCEKYPKMCEAPFNCQTYNPVDTMRALAQGFAPTGEPNVQLWCSAPFYSNYAHMCLVEKDLVKAGQIQYKWSVDSKTGVDELDASYCFIEGHCSNEAVTNQTTLKEANQMCNERYGKDWMNFGFKDVMSKWERFKMQVSQPTSNGFHDTAVTKIFLKAACAMGNYHCDVAYCKETYCKKDYYIKKYAHLAPKAPGHLIQQKEWLD